MKERHIANIAILIIVSIIVGCAGISPQKLIPDTNPAPTNRFDKTIRVLDVRGRAHKKYFGGQEWVSNQEYKEALVATLKKSNLFKEVRTDKESDYELHTEIIAHGQGDHGLDYTSTMVVEYRIVDAKTQKEVWRKGFNSRHEVKFSEAFSGATRTTKAQEGSVRKNLSQLVNSLFSSDFK